MHTNLNALDIYTNDFLWWVWGSTDCDEIKVFEGAYGFHNGPCDYLDYMWWDAVMWFVGIWRRLLHI